MVVKEGMFYCFGVTGVRVVRQGLHAGGSRGMVGSGGRSDDGV